MKKLIAILCLALPSIFLLTQCQPSSSSGEVLYKNNCANCHMDNGQGLGELYPSLLESGLVQDASIEIACLMRNGILADSDATARFEEYNMPPNKNLSDVDIINILNYMQKTFATTPATYKANEVRAKLKSCKE